jgi:two-component system sensor histidine kinase MprB
LRWKVAVALASLTLAATIIVGFAGYRSTRDRLFAEVDRSLVEADLGRGRPELDRLPERGPFGGFEAQLVDVHGDVRQSTFAEPFTPSPDALALAGIPRSNVFETIAVDGTEFRVRSIGLPDGVLQVGRSLEETDRVLASLRRRTILLSLAVAASASVVGFWIAARMTASLRRLTSAAEHVETTGRLDTSVGAAGRDEVGRLGVAFDRMLAALARSQADQQRLVQDAGHELRTPLTSLRTNLDALRRYPAMPPGDRDAIVADLHAETEQLTELVNEIVSVASGDQLDEPRQPFDLADLVAEASTRYERRSGRRIVVIAEPSPVTAQRSAVLRAVSCLLDNACKFDDGDGAIEVTVRQGGVAVADRGPGIPESDLSAVFDRFHRSEAARAMPGSGLGLSIVGDIAARHDGTVFARNRDGGGAVVGFALG